VDFAVEAARGFAHGEEEDGVQEGGGERDDQVQHLEDLGVCSIFATLIHSLYDYTSPHTKSYHPWHPEK